MRWLFWVATSLVVYTYLGYMGWLWLRTRLRARPVVRARREPSISIVMVVRNEDKVLDRKMRNLLELDYPPERCQIIVVSDGSTDRTNKILSGFAQHPRVHVVMKQLSRGKASGLNDASTLAQGEIVVFTDARQTIERGAVCMLIENFADANVGAASGELMLGDPESGEAAEGMGLYWRIEKKIRELEAASGSVVGATGALYAVRRELVTAVPEGTILDDVYIPIHVVKRGKRVVLDRRARVWDSPDLGAEREFSRKVRTLSGNYQLLQLAPWLLSGANPVRFEFVSHKLLRLMAPFALLAVFLTSAVLPGSAYRVVWILQVAFYAMSLLALLRLKHGWLARAAGGALAFVLLNSAAVVAFANYAGGRKTEWGR
jgi:cellulose synthase/poly-beta-1,6-N-acetylglucosamine synthase-like glycosyltransferase